MTLKQCKLHICVFKSHSSLGLQMSQQCINKTKIKVFQPTFHEKKTAQSQQINFSEQEDYTCFTVTYVGEAW